MTCACHSSNSTRITWPPLCGRGRESSFCPLTSLFNLTRCACLLAAHRVAFFDGVAV
ncbi:hypothetical protein SAMN06265373_108122 [Shimia sagamensis]|uniref:Uncharacterized protein n=1 Tax=Shimia sagamensis TaxID=1566352 RepID=A0ABY1PEH2_9RHOB|nr:hypothetical protein SAMN06265373_108122 [Shimia sagamensis]